MAKLNSSCAGVEFSRFLLPVRNEVLEQAIEKLVCLGARAGMNADRMIEMLDSGMTVEELLLYVLSLTPRQPEWRMARFGFRTRKETSHASETD